MNEDELKELLENTAGAINEFAENLLKSTNGLKNSTKAAGIETSSRVKNASSFNALSTALQGSVDEQEGYTDTVEASSKVWSNMTGAVSGVASVLMQMTNDLLGGEGFGMFKKMIDPIADVMESLGTVMGDLVGGLFKAFGDVSLIGGGMEVIGTAAEAAGKALGKVAAAAFKFVASIAIDAVEQLFNMFEGAASAGLLVTDGLNQMLTNARALNLTTQEYTDLIKSQAANMAIFGGSVAAGAAKLKSVAKYSEEFSVELRTLGITFTEQAELQSEAMTQWARTGQLRSMTDEQISDITVNYMKNLSVVSALTGKKADEMKAERDKMLQNMAIQAKLSTMTPEVQKELQAAMDFLGPEFQKAGGEVLLFQKVMSDVGAISTGADVFIQKFINSVADGSTKYDVALQTMLNDIKDSGPEIRARLISLKSASEAEWIGVGTPVTAAVQEAAFGFQKILSIAENGTADLVEKTKTAGEEQDQGVKDLMETMRAERDLMHIILEAAYDELPAIAKVLRNTTESVAKLFKKILEESKEGGMISDAKKKLTAGMDTLSDMVACGASAFKKLSKMIDDIVASKTYKRFFGPETPLQQEPSAEVMDFTEIEDANMQTPAYRTTLDEQKVKLQTVIDTHTARVTEEQARIENSKKEGEKEYWFKSDDEGRAESREIIESSKKTLEVFNKLLEAQNKAIEIQEAANAIAKDGNDLLGTANKDRLEVNG